MIVKFMTLNLYAPTFTELFPHFFMRLHKEALDKFCNRELAIDDFQSSSVFLFPYYLGRTIHVFIFSMFLNFKRPLLCAFPTPKLTLTCTHACQPIQFTPNFCAGKFSLQVHTAFSRFNTGLKQIAYLFVFLYILCIICICRFPFCQ